MFVSGGISTSFSAPTSELTQDSSAHSTLCHMFPESRKLATQGILIDSKNELRNLAFLNFFFQIR